MNEKVKKFFSSIGGKIVALAVGIGGFFIAKLISSGMIKKETKKKEEIKQDIKDLNDDVNNVEKKTDEVETKVDDLKDHIDNTSKDKKDKKEKSDEKAKNSASALGFTKKEDKK